MTERKATRIDVWWRTFGICGYCGKWHHFKKNWEIEHINPKINGGSDKYENLIVSCGPCNSKKGGRTAQEFKLQLINKYKKDIKTTLLESKHGKYLHQYLINENDFIKFAVEISNVFDKYINAKNVKFYFERDEAVFYDDDREIFKEVDKNGTR